jgi:hypothetical protein
MTASDNVPHLKPWTPATYRIEVDGRPQESWLDSLGGMRITSRIRKDHTVVTTLIGRLRDQGELSGVLNNLYDLHLPILSVSCISSESSNHE